MIPNAGYGISIHALREEGDCLLWLMIRVSTTFLSTPSVRRATGSKIIVEQDGVFLSTPSARRATTRGIDVVDAGRISIHALREEGDPLCAGCKTTEKNFYPRPPRGGRRELALWDEEKLAISIHALREEGDLP